MSSSSHRHLCLAAKPANRAHLSNQQKALPDQRCGPRHGQDMAQRWGAEVKKATGTTARVCSTICISCWELLVFNVVSHHQKAPTKGQRHTNLLLNTLWTSYNILYLSIFANGKNKQTTWSHSASQMRTTALGAHFLPSTNVFVT